MVKTSEISQRQVDIFNFVKLNQPVEQRKIIDHFHIKFGYASLTSARTSVGEILKKLKNQNKLKVATKKNEASGFIDKNIWSVK